MSTSNILFSLYVNILRVSIATKHTEGAFRYARSIWDYSGGVGKQVQNTLVQGSIYWMLNNQERKKNT